jgi:hypothetical protein
MLLLIDGVKNQLAVIALEVIKLHLEYCNYHKPLKSNVALAGVAELVDALDSKSSFGNKVRVRFPPPAPIL